MELEIKGFIEFCRFLAQNPAKIIDNPKLFEVLDFCYKSISSCNCANKPPDIKVEEEYFKQISILPEDMLKILGEIFNTRGDLESIYITFPINDIKIKLK